MNSKTDLSSALGAIRLATRGSALALAQTRQAADALRTAGVRDLREVVLRTAADRHPELPLERLEGQGWFVAELERAVLEGEAEVAVHSAKDLPTALAPGLCIAALLPRGDARDASVTSGGKPLNGLRPGSTVGTGSARRVAFLASLYPHLVAVPIRGNVDTRLRKLDTGEVDALLLAAAGLDRLGLGARAAERLDPQAFVPAPAQGAIALEARCESPPAACCRSADDAPTRAAVTAERAVLAALGGGCLLPLGAWARFEEGRLVLTAALAAGGTIKRAELAAHPDAAERLGIEVAAQLG